MYDYKQAISYNNESNNEKQILEQLKIIIDNGYVMIRLFGSIESSNLILRLIDNNKLELKVFLGIQFLPELIDQEAHPTKLLKTKDVILNKKENQKNIEMLINLALKHDETIRYISVGYMNVASYDTHIISRVELNKYIKMVKQKVTQKITYSDSFYLWNTTLSDMTSVVDFVSIQVHPYTQDKFNKDAFDYLSLVYEATKENLGMLPIVVSETGYPKKDGTGTSIKENQSTFIKSVQTWAMTNDVLVVLHEAFSKTSHTENHLMDYGIL